MDLQQFLDRFNEIAGNQGEPWVEVDNGDTFCFLDGEPAIECADSYGEPSLIFGNCGLRELIATMPVWAPEAIERAIKAEALNRELMQVLENIRPFVEIGNQVSMVMRSKGMEPGYFENYTKYQKLLRNQKEDDKC